MHFNCDIRFCLREVNCLPKSANPSATQPKKFHFARPPRGARRLSAWTAGVVLSTVFMACLFAYADRYYMTNDDQFLLRAIVGCQPGGSATFHMYLYPLIAWPLHWASALFPGIVWFSVLQTAFLWLANTVIIKSIWQCFARANRPGWQAMIASVGFLLLFAVRADTRITYTITAAMVGGAAVAQLMSIDAVKTPPRAYLGRVSGGLALFLAAASLRNNTALPMIGFLGVALVLHAMQRWPEHATLAARLAALRPQLLALAGLALAYGLLEGGRALDVILQGEQADVQWQLARTSVTDYLRMNLLPGDVIAKAGWSQGQATLLYYWYTMDAAFSTQAFQAAAASAPQELYVTPGAALADLINRTPLTWLAMLTVAMYGVCCFLWVCPRSRGKSRLLTVPLLLAGAGCLGMLGYLALLGRLPERAVMAPLVPLAVVLLCLTPQCLPRPFRGPGLWRGLLVRLVPGLVAFALLVATVVPVAASVKRVPPQWDYDTFADMDQQALSHPDLLLIYEHNLVNDTRMFPDFSQGIPTNLTFWGGWIRGTKEYRNKLAAFGLDAEHFTAGDWLNPAVRLVTIDKEPNELLLAYLREQLGSRVSYRREQVSVGLYLYQFILTDEAAPPVADANGVGNPSAIQAE